MHDGTPPPTLTLTSEHASQRARELVDEIGRALEGKRDAVSARGHCPPRAWHLLVEDVPGVGKTTLARALAKVPGRRDASGAVHVGSLAGRRAGGLGLRA
jgi:MoxR-like ATPase